MGRRGVWSVSCVMREGVDCEWCGDGEERGCGV